MIHLPLTMQTRHPARDGLKRQKMNQGCLWHVVSRALNLLEKVPWEMGGKDKLERESCQLSFSLPWRERMKSLFLCIWGYSRSEGQSPVPGDFKVVEEFPEW